MCRNLHPPVTFWGFYWKHILIFSFGRGNKIFIISNNPVVIRSCCCSRFTVVINAAECVYVFYLISNANKAALVAFVLFADMWYHFYNNKHNCADTSGPAETRKLLRTNIFDQVYGFSILMTFEKSNLCLFKCMAEVLGHSYGKLTWEIVKIVLGLHFNVS